MHRQHKAYDKLRSYANMLENSHRELQSYHEEKLNGINKGSHNQNQSTENKYEYVHDDGDYRKTERADSATVGSSGRYHCKSIMGGREDVRGGEHEREEEQENEKQRMNESGNTVCTLSSYTGSSDGVLGGESSLEMWRRTRDREKEKERERERERDRNTVAEVGISGMVVDGTQRSGEEEEEEGFVALHNQTHVDYNNNNNSNTGDDDDDDEDDNSQQQPHFSPYQQHFHVSHTAYEATALLNSDDDDDDDDEEEDGEAASDRRFSLAEAIVGGSTLDFNDDGEDQNQYHNGKELVKFEETGDQHNEFESVYEEAALGAASPQLFHASDSLRHQLNVKISPSHQLLSHMGDTHGSIYSSSSGHAIRNSTGGVNADSYYECNNNAGDDIDGFHNSMNGELQLRAVLENFASIDEGTYDVKHDSSSHGLITTQEAVATSSPATTEGIGGEHSCIGDNIGGDIDDESFPASLESLSALAAASSDTASDTAENSNSRKSSNIIDNSLIPTASYAGRRGPQQSSLVQAPRVTTASVAGWSSTIPPSSNKQQFSTSGGVAAGVLNLNRSSSSSSSRNNNVIIEPPDDDDDDYEAAFDIYGPDSST